MSVPIFELSTEELWSEYLLTRSERIRDELVKRYLPYASRIAEKTSYKIDTTICPYDDLQEAAWMAVLKCVEKFDPEVGYSEDIDKRFTAYASFRIKGACIDEFRLHCWVNPRSQAADKHGIRPASFSNMVDIDEVEIDFEPDAREEDIESEIDSSGLLDQSFLLEQCALTPEETEIILSVYGKGMSHNQVAEQMNYHGDKIYKRKAKAIEKIRLFYKRQQIDKLMADQDMTRLCVT